MTGYTEGSPLTFTPDTTGRWAVRFRVDSDEETWTDPVIGWAIVVVYRSADEVETRVDPVILTTDGDTRRPDSVRGAMILLPGGVSWTLVDLNNPTSVDLQAQAEERHQRAQARYQHRCGRPRLDGMACGTPVALDGMACARHTRDLLARELGARIIGQSGVTS